MRFVRASRHTNDSPACVGVPVRRPEASKSGHENYAVSVWNACSQGFDFGCATDNPQSIAQPLDNGAGHEDATFQHVTGMSMFGGAAGPAYGGHQIIMRCHGASASIHKHETTCPIGVFS